MNDIVTNGSEIKQRILSEINNARQSIYLAMAWFTDRDIATAIIEAKNKGLTIDIILSSNVQNETVKLMLKGANITVHAFETGDARGIMHHKFCLIDNKITINGSYNYSYNASNNNVENIHVSDNSETYSQLLSEFERLKYKIDNRIDVNSTIQPLETKIPKVQTINIIDTFFQQLHNLVYSSSQINAEDYKKKGKDTSKECQGNIDIFKTEYSKIKEEIKAYATDDSLSNKKSILTSNISSAYESTLTNLNAEKQEKVAEAIKNNELEKRQTSDKVVIVKQEKTLLESGNQNTGEKGLLQINKEIEKNKLERRALEQSFVVKKFWSVGTILVSFFLLIFVCYLSVFFASALYKMLFESDVIRGALEAGINPGLPKLVDANAIIKIFKQQGFLFGFIALIFSFFQFYYQT
jgi:PLD-like domain